MSTLILTAESSKTPIGDVLRGATDNVIDVKDAAGRLVAKIQVTTPREEVDPRALAQSTAEIETLRRRRLQDSSLDITTAELLAKARSSAGE